MSESIRSVLVADHQRLARLLDLAQLTVPPPAAYEDFRGGLLRHIGVEERILLPALRRANAEFLETEQLRLDHSALVAMLVPPPTRHLLTRIHALLRLHDPLEEGDCGLYSLADRALDVPVVVEQILSAPTPPLAPNNPTLRARENIELLLARARRRLP